MVENGIVADDDKEIGYIYMLNFFLLEDFSIFINNSGTFRNYWERDRC